MKNFKFKFFYVILCSTTVFTVQAQTKPAQQPIQQPVAVISESTKALCKTAELIIEESLTTISNETISGIADNSAPRETNRQLRVVAATNQILIQQLHMQSLQCPAIQKSIRIYKY
jgi:phosphoserine aminotransferase